MLNDRNSEFFDMNHKAGLCLTFDDVLLLPRHSNVIPARADTSTRLSRNYRLKIPIIGAAMSTVTEAPMAIALAEGGGCGVIHRNHGAAWQAEQVVRVKLSRSGFVEKPKTVLVDSTVGELLDRLDARANEGKNLFHSFPVVDDKDTVVGLIGRIDIERYRTQREKCIGDIMTPYDELLTGDPGMEAEAAYKKLQPTRWSVLPLVDPDSRSLKGLYTFKPLQRMFELDSSSYALDTAGRLIAAAAVGVGLGEPERAELLMQHGVNLIVVDSSHGDTEGVIEMAKQCKRIAGNAPVDVVGGNVATYDGAKRLLDAGCDAIKVGIGPGSICTTREVTGFGVPQLSAIVGAARAAMEYDIPVIADGGMSTSGDIVKALVAGADCVMLGSMLASTDEAPGESYVRNGIRVKDYNGMGSPTSMLERAGQQRYSQAGVSSGNIAAQGIDAAIQYRGSVKRVLSVYVNGIQSGMGLGGAATISELQRNVQFIRQTGNGLAESRVHDVIPV